VRLLAVTTLLLALATGSAGAATGFVRMSDGVRLHYTLLEPPGPAPRAGRPAVLVMHGLGGSDVQLAPAARFFAGHGYAALAFSVRGQGASGGQLGLVSARDVADLRAMVAWLVRRPEVSGRVGCFGISLGGGECWAGTAAGLFGAVAPVATWTELATALWPGGAARSGVLTELGGGSFGGLAALAGTTLPPFAEPLLAQRSVAAKLARIRTPAYLFQGKVDYVFDVAQATAAFDRLGGPRKLYLGDFGHTPSSFSSADFPGYVLEQSARWFDRFLRGRRNGIERPRVVVRGGPRGTRLPATRVVHAGRAARTVTTFGASTVRVRVRRLGRAQRLVAVVRADGRVVTHGAVVPRVGANTIRLADYVVRIPKGARLTVRVDARGDAAYRLPAGTPPGSPRVDAPRLDLRVLR
jgi:predicted acyl esterase